jgi:ribosomal protein S18 acetylase RimI-like enzyme
MAEGIAIRNAGRKDFDFILCLSVETIWTELTPYEQAHTSRRRLVNTMAKNLRRLMASSSMLTLVAETADGERAGFMMVGRSTSVFTDRQQAFVYDVAVAPPFRRRGIGRMLMERAEAYARDKRMEFITLMVDCRNEAARRLYSQLGFEDGKVLMRKLLVESPLDKLARAGEPGAPQDQPDKS